MANSLTFSCGSLPVTGWQLDDVRIHYMLVQTCCLEMVPGDGGMFTHTPCGMSLDAEFCLTTFK